VYDPISPVPEGLSSSEWVCAIKMIANVAPVRAIPGRSLDGSRCRHCNETETLPHVLGYSAHGALMRNSRHNVIRKMIADTARQKKNKVEEEMTCIAQGGSIRRFGILIIDERTQKAWMIDPTIRLETCKDCNGPGRLGHNDYVS